MERVAALMVAVLLSGVLAACQGGPAARHTSVRAAGPAIKVGAIFDLSGATSDVGRPYAAGVKAYVDYTNERGGIRGQQIDLISADYAYKVENAERLYAEFVAREGVVAIIGWGTADSEALKTKITSDKLPFVSASLSETLADPFVAPYNFVIGATYSDQMRVALRYILQQHSDASGIKVAFLYNDSPFGRAPEAAFDEIAAAEGLAVKKVAMPRGAIDLVVQIKQLHSFDPDYVIIQNTPGPSALALKDAAVVGMDAQFVLLNFAANEILINAADEAAEGVIGVMPFVPPSADLAAVKTINAYLNRKNLGTLADKDKGLVYSQGWATAAILVEGIRRAASSGAITGDSIKAGLESFQNFDTGGITAPISFGPNDHQGATALRLYQVQAGQWIPISEMLEIPH